MKFLKQFSVLTLAFAAGAASAATAQTFTAATGNVTIDTAVLTAKGFTAASVGPSTYNATTGMLTDPLQGVSLITTPGALLIDFADAGGIALSTQTFLGKVTITLNNFTFNLATNTLSGDLLSAFGNYYSQDLLVSSSVSSSFGTESGTNASASTTSRSLGLLASAFTMAPDLVAKLGANASSFTFVADTIKQIKVGTVVTPTPSVPEPSTYALLGLGLVGISLVARRKHNA